MDPLGLASFLQKRVLENKTSGQNIAEDITGSRRGASQPATDASPTLGASQAPSRASLLELELGVPEEEHSKLSYDRLVGAVHGERWCFPGVGKPPDFLVPVRTFSAEEILARYPVKLTRQKKDGHHSGMRRQENSSYPLHLCPPLSAGTDARTCMGPWRESRTTRAWCL